MTKPQHAKYMKEWSRAYRTHWAGVRNGEVLSRPGRPDSALREEILAIARREAAADPVDGRLTPDRLRHACHIHALGRNISSWDLTNRQWDKVVAVFRLLNDPANIGADIAVSDHQAHPMRPDRKRVAFALQKLDLPDAYIGEISRDKFGSSNWRQLTEVQLQQLLITCKARALSRRASNLIKAATNAAPLS